MLMVCCLLYLTVHAHMHVQTLDVELLHRGPREADRLAGTVPPARFAHGAAPVLCRTTQGQRTVVGCVHFEWIVGGSLGMCNMCVGLGAVFVWICSFCMWVGLVRIVYDRIYGDFPAKNTMYTLCMYVVLTNVYIVVHCGMYMVLTDVYIVYVYGFDKCIHCGTLWYVYGFDQCIHCVCI